MAETCITLDRKIAPPSNILYFVVSIFPSLISLVANGTVILAIARNSSLRTSTNILLGGLAVTDLVCTLVLQIPYTLLFSFGRPMASCFVTDAVTVVAISLFVSTLSILTVVTYDRYIRFSIGPNFTGDGRMRSYIFLLCSWVIGFMIGLGYLTISKNIIRTILTIHTLFCVLYICIAYHYITRKLSTREHELRENMESANYQVLRTFIATQKRSLRTVLVIVAILFLSIVPMMVAVGYGWYAMEKSRDSFVHTYQVFAWASIVYFLNSSLDPFVYAAKHYDLSKAMKKELKVFKHFLCPCQRRRNRIQGKNSNKIIVSSGTPNREG